MKILITGGAGFIGSHTALSLLKEDFEIVVLDNLSNGYFKALKKIEKLTNKKITFIKGDIRDKKTLDNIFQTNNIESVIHFAGLKSVGESGQKPLDYYNVNLFGTLSLIESMVKNKIKKFIFSSSATVYGNAPLPYTEKSPTEKPSSVYGRTKWMTEIMLEDIYNANDDLSITLLRYFNPIGADQSGEIGEDPIGKPNNLMPFITQTAIGKQKCLNIFGNDYSTKDGTCERDYIHISDLAEGHILALKNMNQNKEFKVYNLGTGKVFSVLEIIKSFEKENNIKINYQFAPKRDGDLPASYASTRLAEEELGFKTKKDLKDMVKDSWNWQINNPKGFNEKYK